MKQLICALMLLVPFACYSKDKGKGKDQLTGNWKEVKRQNVGGKKIDYTDTLYIKFEVGNQYVRQQGKGFIYRGVYKILSNTLDIGTRTYTIMEMKKKRIVLKDQMGTYELEPYTPVNQIVPGRAPEVYKPVTSISQMVGSWDKFKGTSSGTHDRIDYTRTVKKVEIFSQPQDGKYGYIYAGRDGENAPSWYVESFSNQTLFCNGKDRRQFKVLKAENNELIIEGEGFTYFLRRFR